MALSPCFSSPCFSLLHPPPFSLCRRQKRAASLSEGVLQLGIADGQSALKDGEKLLAHDPGLSRFSGPLKCALRGAGGVGRRLKFSALRQRRGQCHLLLARRRRGRTNESLRQLPRLRPLARSVIGMRRQ